MRDRNDVLGTGTARLQGVARGMRGIEFEHRHVQTHTVMDAQRRPH